MILIQLLVETHIDVTDRNTKLGSNQDNVIRFRDEESTRDGRV